MKAVVHHEVVRVHCPDGGLIEFKRSGDTNCAKTPTIVKTTAPRYLKPGYRAAKAALEFDQWGAR